MIRIVEKVYIILIIIIYFDLISQNIIEFMSFVIFFKFYKYYILYIYHK